MSGGARLGALALGLFLLFVLGMFCLTVADTVRLVP